ncbi:uncharacterized protein LOC134766148 [Penaeus indicus]|uniref:uncharacterized protein LOC134766148 n=1 Tax=Penaeus indicus TaxID=29960 RepID=UPI00300C1046
MDSAAAGPCCPSKRSFTRQRRHGMVRSGEERQVGWHRASAPAPREAAAWGTASVCPQPPRRELLHAASSASTTAAAAAEMPKPKEEIDDGLRQPPEKITHSFNEEFFAMAALCLASAFAFFCCPIFMERPQQ